MSWRAARSAGDEEAEERLTAEDRRSRTGSTVDPLSDEDPSGSKVGNTISRFGVAFIVGIIVLVVGMQVGYGVMRWSWGMLGERCSRHAGGSAGESGPHHNPCLRTHGA